MRDSASACPPPATLSDYLLRLPGPTSPPPPDTVPDAPCVLVTRIAALFNSDEDHSPVPDTRASSPPPARGLHVTVCDVGVHLSLRQWRALTGLLGCASALPAVPPVASRRAKDPPVRHTGSQRGGDHPGTSEGTLRVTRINILVETEEGCSVPAGAGLPALSFHAASLHLEHRSNSPHVRHLELIKSLGFRVISGPMHAGRFTDNV